MGVRSRLGEMWVGLLIMLTVLTFIAVAVGEDLMLWVPTASLWLCYFVVRMVRRRVRAGVPGEAAGRAD